MDEVALYGGDWCPDCRRSKRLLNRLGVPFTYFDVDEDDSAMAAMLAMNGGRQSIPVVVLPDGQVLVEPSDPALRSGLEAAGLLPT